MFTDGSKVRFGLIVGDRGDVLASPFSAPFGGFDFTRNEGIDKIDEAVAALCRYADKPVKITLPPPFHAPEMQPKIASALMRMPGVCIMADLNYHYDFAVVSDWESGLDRATRNKFRTSLKQGFEFTKLPVTDSNVARVYAVISCNHATLGNPLRMTLAQVQATVRVVRADLFVLSYGQSDVAAALVYHVAPGIVQVIYWGDTVEARALRPMNFLSWKVVEHYRRAGMRIYDLGPASEAGLPNPGLCEFKEGLGCLPTLKYSFILGD